VQHSLGHTLGPPAWLSFSHSLVYPQVTPTVDGMQVGPFLLDSGASGLVVTRAAAEKLSLERFGKVYVSGVAGKVPCDFRRGGVLSFGPITITSPLFMQMELGSVVRRSVLCTVSLPRTA
jgi:hypothetical protein